MKTSNITGRDVEESTDAAHKRYDALYKDYVLSRDVLQSDGPNFINGR